MNELVPYDTPSGDKLLGFEMEPKEVMVSTQAVLVVATIGATSGSSLTSSATSSATSSITSSVCLV